MYAHTKCTALFSSLSAGMIAKSKDRDDECKFRLGLRQVMQNTAESDSQHKQ